MFTAVEGCFACGKADATLWCEACSRCTSGYVCGQCDVSEHSTHAGQLHCRITLEEKAKRPCTPSYAKCNTHQAKKKLFCNDCACLICLYCALDEHKHHRTSSVHKRAEAVKTELKECLRPLGDTQFLVDIKNSLAAEQKRNEKELELLERRMRELEQTIGKNTHSLNEIDERKAKFSACEVAMGKVIDQMGVLELADRERVNEMKCRIARLVEDLYEPERTRKAAEKQEKERMEKLKLDLTCYHGGADLCAILEDGLTLIKAQSGHCSISSTNPITQWRVRYIGATRNDNTHGWLFIGVHSDPANASQTSFYEDDCFGLNVIGNAKTNNCAIYKAGSREHVGGLTVAVGDVICAEVVANQLTVRMENGAWSKTIDLPAGRTWYPHFNPHSASFSLF